MMRNIEMARYRRMMLASVAMAALASPMSVGGVRADDSDGFAALAVLMGVATEAVAATIRTQDKAFIDTCTDAKIDRWRAKDVRVSSLWDAKRLEDECVLEAVQNEIGRIKAEEESKAAANAAKWKEEEAISDRLLAARRAKEAASAGMQVVAASGPVAVKGSLKGRRRVEYLANGSMQINW
jgi:hypothetical protein